MTELLLTLAAVFAGLCAIASVGAWLGRGFDKSRPQPDSGEGGR